VCECTYVIYRSKSKMKTAEGYYTTERIFRTFDLSRDSSTIRVRKKNTDSVRVEVANVFRASIFLTDDGCVTNLFGTVASRIFLMMIVRIGGLF